MRSAMISLNKGGNPGIVDFKDEEHAENGGQDIV